jgi:hypothetical protein
VQNLVTNKLPCPIEVDWKDGKDLLAQTRKATIEMAPVHPDISVIGRNNLGRTSQSLLVGQERTGILSQIFRGFDSK